MNFGSRFLGFVVLVATAISVVSATTYSVSITSGLSISATADGVAATASSYTGNTLSYSLAGATVSVDTSASTYSPSTTFGLTLPYSSQEFRVISGTASTFYVVQARIVNSPTYAYYFSNATVPIWCAAVVDFNLRGFSCYNATNDTIATFADTSSKTDFPYNVTFTSSTTSTDTIQALLTIASYRAYQVGVQQNAANAIYSNTYNRHNILQNFAGALYAILLLQVLALLIVSTVYIGRIKVDIFGHHLAKYVIFLVLAVITILVISLGGFPGFFAIEGLFLLIAIIGPIVSCIWCANVDVNDPWGSATGARPRFERVDRKPGKVFALYVLILICLIFSIVWIYEFSIPTYTVYTRGTAQTITEFQPAVIAKSIAAVYAYRDFANNMHVAPILKAQTDYCQTEYRKTLASDSDKNTAIKVGFVDKYSINMSLFNSSNYLDYSTVNAWFFRHLASGVRPIAFPNDGKLISSVADSRVVAFATIGTDQEIWLKGTAFTVSALLSGSSYTQQFIPGSVMINRLSPQDYHRFHSPVSGTVVAQFSIAGEYHSVNADAVTSGNEVLVRNVRVVSIINATVTGESESYVAFVAVGATCVGSVQMTIKVNDTITRGDDIGFFQFGGSTIVTIYQQGRVQFADDLLRNSFKPVETYLDMGSPVGTFI